MIDYICLYSDISYLFTFSFTQVNCEYQNLYTYYNSLCKEDTKLTKLSYVISEINELELIDERDQEEEEELQRLLQQISNIERNELEEILKKLHQEKRKIDLQLTEIEIYCQRIFNISI